MTEDQSREWEELDFNFEVGHLLLPRLGMSIRTRALHGDTHSHECTTYQQRTIELGKFLRSIFWYCNFDWTKLMCIFSDFIQ